MPGLKILLLGEGDPTTRDCWSGTPAGLYRELVKRGHDVVGLDVSLSGPSRVGAALSTLSLNRRRWGVKFHLLDPGRRLRSSKARALVSQHPNVDLVIQFGGTFNVDLPVATWVYADATIELALEAAQTGHGDAAMLRQPELDEVFRQEKAVYDGVDGIFSMSDRCRSSFMGRFGQPEGRVVTIYAGANYDELPPPPDRGAKEPDPVILFVGRAFERKGGDSLLRAFSRLRERSPTAELWIVGPDKRGLSQPGVREFGFIDKDAPGGEERVRSLYESATVFCLPTEYEPFGIAYVEAMMHELPCVGPDAWAVPEIVVDGQTGVLYEPGSVSSLTDALLRLVSDPDLARKMGAAGRQRALETFTWSAVVDRVLAAIER